MSFMGSLDALPPACLAEIRRRVEEAHRANLTFTVDLGRLEESSSLPPSFPGMPAHLQIAGAG